MACYADDVSVDKGSSVCRHPRGSDAKTSFIVPYSFIARLCVR